MTIYPGVVTGTLTVGGVTVTYHDGGKSSAGDPTIVLLHGTGGRTDTHFFTLYPMLASRHRVVGLDLSDSPSGADGLTVDALVTQVRGALTQLVPGEEVVLLGYSLGAAVALATAADCPGLVSSLVLLNGWATTDNAVKLRLSLWRQLFETGRARELAEYMLLNVYSRAFLNARTWAEIQQLITDYVVGPGSERQMQLNSSLDVSDKLPDIQARTLVIGSEEDQLIPIHHSLELFGAIENARFKQLGGGHASVTERPAEIFHLVDAFVRDQQTGESDAVLNDDLLQQLNTF